MNTTYPHVKCEIIKTFDKDPEEQNLVISAPKKFSIVKVTTEDSEFAGNSFIIHTAKIIKKDDQNIVNENDLLAQYGV